MDDEERYTARRAGAQGTRFAQRITPLALALLFFGVACTRTPLVVRLVSGDAALALVGVALQAGSAFAAGIGVLRGRSWTQLALAAFGVGVLIQAVAAVFVYGAWALLPALGACLAVATALIVLAVLVAPSLEPTAGTRRSDSGRQPPSVAR